MRSLEECKREIFRRSDEKIKARRKNMGRALVWGLSACLVLCTVRVLPHMRADKNAEMPEAVAGGIGGEYVQAEILIKNDGTENTRLVTDGAAVKKLFNTVEGLYEGADGAENNGASGSAEEAAPESFQKGTLSCRITFTGREGLETVYALNGNELVNRTSNQRLILTEMQLSELKNLLGLTG